MPLTFKTLLLYWQCYFLLLVLMYIAYKDVTWMDRRQVHGGVPCALHTFPL